MAMKKHTDRELGGYALIGDGTLDIIENARRGCEGGRAHIFEMPEWTGRPFPDWRGMRASFGKPWSEGLAVINDFAARLRKENIEAPRSLRRRAQFNELDGDVEVDRVLAADPCYFRRVLRAETRNSTNLSLVCQLGANCKTTARDIFWQGAATAAAIDLLEDAGYSCEVWVWSLTERAFEREHALHHIFTAVRLKNCGSPLDMDTLACGLSSWFFRLAVISNYHNIPTDRKLRGNHGWCVDSLGGWSKYLDLSDGIRRVDMPVARDRDSAADAARQVLAQVSRPLES